MSDSGTNFKFNTQAHITFVRDNRLDGHVTLNVHGNSWQELKDNSGSLAKQYADEFGIDYVKIKIRLGDSENIVDKFEDLFFTIS